MFVMPSSAAHACARREALLEYTRLEAEITRLQTTAKKEVQIHRLVELNIEIKRLQAVCTATRAKL
jgi:hypothetical protein